MIEEAVDHVVEQLKGRGLNAASDPRSLTLPGVLVALDSLQAVLNDGLVVRCRLLAIARDNGHPLPQLDDLLDGLAGMAELPASAVSVLLGNHSPAPSPALELFTTITVTKE